MAGDGEQGGGSEQGPHCQVGGWERSPRSCGRRGPEAVPASQRSAPSFRRDLGSGFGGGQIERGAGSGVGVVTPLVDPREHGLEGRGWAVPWGGG